jgi:hypothetical protein
MDCAEKENIVTQKTIIFFKSYLLMEFLGIVHLFEAPFCPRSFSWSGEAQVKVPYTSEYT